MNLSRSITGALALVVSLLTSLPATAEMTLDAGTSVTFHHYDLLGSPVMVSDHRGRVLWYENTKPYGGGLGKKSSSGLGHLDNAVSEAASNLGYTGHTVDSSTGLVYMKARHYDPVIGRFYSNDPVGFTTSNPMMFNRYAYANNNPYVFLDPDGRSGEAIFTEVLPAAGDAIAGLAAWTVGHITGDQNLVDVAVQGMAENSSEGLWAIAAVFTPPGFNKARKLAARGNVPKGPRVGGGANQKYLSPGEQKRIQNAADKSGAEITVVGSQTTGKKVGSDFDFILEGGTSRSRSKIKNSLPQGPRGTGEGNGRDFLPGPVDESLPFITFTPKSKL